MQIGKNTVVSLNYELTDSSGKVIEKTKAPITYLHGGYDGIFPLVETALQGKNVGDRCKVTLAPDDAFGEYEADMVRTEPKNLFPENISVGHAIRRRDRGLRRLHPLHGQGNCRR